MTDLSYKKEKLVFGLDIGTRSIVGTVGYQKGDRFFVVAQRSIEHETRAMLDGQIHDIHQVGGTIAKVKAELEEAIGQELKEVCIAAAGRVLRTITTHVEQEFQTEKVLNEEDILSLISLGIEHAYEEFVNEDSTNSDMKFYCVGHSVVRYYMNGYQIGNLEDHKAKSTGVDLIATFLPEDVVDGLYKAVELADLTVVNLTLEPIAAIQVAIPERFRMLNIALVDVGAGTSDISITNDGSIIAYGMIPTAGDGLTEEIAKHCLVDFEAAEQIKRKAGEQEDIEFTDIMGLPQHISASEVLKLIEPNIEDMTERVANCIKELNGDKAVSAVFVVGGGGKIEGYTRALSEKLGIPSERVALRGEEVMQKIEFLEENVKKDSLLVTPVGICLSFYEENNNFIFVTFNDQRIKIYDNNKLSVVDAAMQAEFPNDGLFPKRGKELQFQVNGKNRMLRGQVGEAAVITVNGKEADIHTSIHSNDVIVVKESTTGEDAALELNQLPEFKDTIGINVNEKDVLLPKFPSVNGNLQSGYYSVQEQDAIEFLDYYTVKQVLEFLDVILEPDHSIFVNNKKADMDTPVYEKFSITWYKEPIQEDSADKVDSADSAISQTNSASETGSEIKQAPETEPAPEQTPEPTSEQVAELEPAPEPVNIVVLVNNKPVTLSGKSSYVYVDVFNFIDFDLSKPQGSRVDTLLNGREALYMENIHDGDVIEIYWRE